MTGLEKIISQAEANHFRNHAKYLTDHRQIISQITGAGKSLHGRNEPFILGVQVYGPLMAGQISFCLFIRLIWRCWNLMDVQESA
jgi:hypothetical protein